MKQEGGSRRKLSKRRDPEATVSFYIEQGYPAPAVQYYLRGLANGRLAEMPLAEALAAPIRLSECGTAGPLVDMVKLDDISADYVATLSGEQILAEVSTWAGRYDARAGRGPGRRTRTGPARPGHRAGGRRQPAQGPAQVGGFPRGLRVLLPAALRAGHRPG